MGVKLMRPVCFSRLLELAFLLAGEWEPKGPTLPLLQVNHYYWLTLDDFPISVDVVVLSPNVESDQPMLGPKLSMWVGLFQAAQDVFHLSLRWGRLEVAAVEVVFPIGLKLPVVFQTIPVHFSTHLSLREWYSVHWFMAKSPLK